MDAAIRGEGYFMIAPVTGGDPALSRRGDFGFDSERFITDGAGSRLLDTDMNPIQLPEARRIVVEETGQIQVELFGAPDGTFVPGPIIATTVAAGVDLVKSIDGHIRPSKNEPLPEPDQRARISQGFLESSNVNTITALVKNIESQRQFEMSVKFISLAQEIDESTSRIMRLPQG
jgi:flagellar basal-body rod protein FlgF